MKISKLTLPVMLAFLFCANTASSQNDKPENQVVKKSIDSILNEKNYTRIPNKDFDEFIENKVSSRINEKFTYWFTIVGIFITAIAGLSAYAFNTKIKQLIAEQVTRQSEQKMEGIRKYILDSRKYTLRSDLEEIKKKIDLNPTSENNISEARKLLAEITDSNNPDLLAEAVDLLAFAYFSNRNPKELEKLIEGNEHNCEIKVTTYMNAAILYSDLYELDGSNWYKENCLKYCKISAQKVPHYGEPQGITLLIYGIDLLNNPNKDIKEASIHNAKELIEQILTGSDFLTAYHTVNRLDRDRENEAFKKYILELDKTLPAEFGKLYERAKKYTEVKKEAVTKEV